MTLDKKENKQRALKVAELLHKALEKSDPFHDYNSYVEDDPNRFLKVHGTWLASYCMLCSSEKQEELQAEQKRILERMEAESRKASKTSRWISIISLVLAGVAIFSSGVAIYSSFFWQKEQIPLLKQIVDNTQQDKEIISK